MNVVELKKKKVVKVIERLMEEELVVREGMKM
jgi:hypothetical protein